MRYDHLEPQIKDYFLSKGINVSIEPHGSRDADLISECGSVVGEIKHAAELRRDLSRKFWSDWNSAASFGGKSSEYKLISDLPGADEILNGPSLGWLAVIYGQLNHYRRKHGLNDGWLVFEDPARHAASFKLALFWLQSHSQVTLLFFAEFKGIGFAQISFN